MMCVTPAVCAAVRVAAFLVLVRRLLSCRKPGKAGVEIPAVLRYRYM